jgi:hypothetical protein
VVSVAGKIGGASGKSVDVADVYFATADNAGGNEATVGTSWTVLEHNLIGAYVAGGTDVPVADGGTGSSTAAGAATNLGLGTGDSPQFTAVNIGHASDTTVTRSGAGDIAVEGNALYRAGGTDVPIGDGGTGSSTAGAARTALGTDVASNITSGDMAAARMQVNLKAALEAVSQTFNSTNTTIDGGTI